MIDEALGKFGIWDRKFQNIFQMDRDYRVCSVYCLYREWMHPTDWRMPWRDALVMIGILSILVWGLWPVTGKIIDWMYKGPRRRAGGMKKRSSKIRELIPRIRR